MLYLFLLEDAKGLKTPATSNLQMPYTIAEMRVLSPFGESVQGKRLHCSHCMKWHLPEGM
jgi:hypothetical protein